MAAATRRQRQQQQQPQQVSDSVDSHPSSASSGGLCSCLSSSSSSGDSDDEDDFYTTSFTSLSSSYADTTVVIDAEDHICARLVRRTSIAARDEMDRPDARTVMQPAATRHQSHAPSNTGSSSSGSSASKQYKHSPFGLTNHYLTLPNSNAADISAIAYNKSHSKSKQRRHKVHDAIGDTEDDTFENGKTTKNMQSMTSATSSDSELSDAIPSIASNIDCQEYQNG